jgi:hypothetical protein
MNPIKEFGAFEGKVYAATTRRVYLSAVNKALKIIGKTPENCGSCEELRALLRENLTQKNLLRLAPFLSFLDSKIPQNPEDIPDYGPIRALVVECIEKETKATRKAAHFIRRDLAMLACLCVAPRKGSPRSWPKSALAVTRQGGGVVVILWEKVVENPSLALALLYWHTWRERLGRPEQSRLYRKAGGWAYSDLLFPNSRGEALKKQAMHNVFARLKLQGADGGRLTPGLIRKAFLQLER